MGGAVVHQVEQQLLGEDIDLQGLAACGLVGVDGDVGGEALAVHGEVVAAAGISLGRGGAHCGDVGAAIHMGGVDVPQGQIDGQVAAGQHHSVLPDVLEVGVHAGQGAMRPR